MDHNIKLSFAQTLKAQFEPALDRVLNVCSLVSKPCEENDLKEQSD